MVRRRVIARNVKVTYVSLEEWAQTIEEIMKEFPKKDAPKLSDEEIRKIARKAVGLDT